MELGALLEADDSVTGLDVGDALADRLDDTGTLVSEDNGESALRILAGEGVRICSFRMSFLVLTAYRMAPYLCGKHQCSESERGPRGPWGQRPRRPQW